MATPMPQLMRRLFLPGLALSWAFGTAVPAVMAADLTDVRVVLFSLPETVWQAKLADQQLSSADLHTRLEALVATREAQCPIDARCTLKDDGEPLTWKRGGMRQFTTAWNVLERGKGLGVTPAQHEERFIGSSLTFEDAAVRSDGTLRVELALLHHTAPPGMRRFNFAQAAEGAERDRLSVEYPEFARLEWRGKLSLTPGWQLVTQALHDAEDKLAGGKAPLPRRHLLFIAAAEVAQAADDMREARQVVIRLPELEAVEIMAETTTPAQGITTEAARVAALWQAVRAGRARVISDVTSTVRLGGTALLQQGHHAWLPSELEQDFDLLQMPPVGFDEYFAGTTLQASFSPSSATLDWQGRCIPRGPLMVKWPVSWLRPFDDRKPDAQPPFPRGWLDFHDTFEQSTTGSVALRSPRMQILAVMPPADQVWPGDRADRWLDVFLAQVKKPGEVPPTTPDPEPAPEAEPKPAAATAASLVPADPFAPVSPVTSPLRPLPHGQMTLFYGIGIGPAEAAQITLKREPDHDAALLERLLARVRAGTARLALCIGSGHDPTSRQNLSSVRLHQVPTEMPSIPSAWNDTHIGTSLELEHTTFSLHHDIAPPGRSEWKLALDDSQAVMWQPRPRFLNLRGDTPALVGTHLVGLLHVPEVLQQPKPDGPNAGANTSASGSPTPSGLRDETILVFSQRRTHPQPENLNADRAPVEAEVIVLEMPGTSVDEFEGLPGDPPPDEEDDRFSQLMSRVQTGEVRVAAHLLAAGHYGRMNALIVEQHQHATEFDPPDSKDQPRMRPTALDTIPAGTELEIDVEPDGESPLKLFANVSLKHSTGLPVEPDLPATLATFAKDENAPYPAGPHPQETWISIPGAYLPDGAGIHLRAGKPFCLGARKPEGLDRKVIHVAYLRVRRL